MEERGVQVGKLGQKQVVSFVKGRRSGYEVGLLVLRVKLNLNMVINQINY